MIYLRPRLTRRGCLCTQSFLLRLHLARMNAAVSPRHTASAIVYVHLGPENGGIIINLGIDGVACQTARKLTVRENTILNVRLRGSGLDVNLAGEIVWQGATQKEIGICFKDPSKSQQQEHHKLDRATRAG